MPVPPKPIEKILDTRPGEITVETPDGDKQKRMGTAAWRMNNPGNLRGKGTFISQMPGYIGEGDAGPSGFFSVFRTKDDGAKAREALLFSGRSKIYTPETSIREAMSRYAPPSENNTDAYVRLVAEAMGVPDTTKIKDLTSGQKSAWLDAITKHEGNREGKTIQAADGGMFSGPKSGYSATLHGDEAVIPLKGGAVPVAMPKDFVEGMSKFKFLTEMLTDKFTENNTSASAKQELEDIKSRAMTGAGPGAEAMLTAFNQMGAELRAQGEANRSLFEAMLRGQSTSNDIQNKMLRYTQN
jgi:hypothetical protein